MAEAEEAVHASPADVPVPVRAPVRVPAAEEPDAARKIFTEPTLSLNILKRNKFYIERNILYENRLRERNQKQ